MFDWALTVLVFFLGIAILSGIGIAVTTMITDGHFPRWHKDAYDNSPGVEQPVPKDEVHQPVH